MAWADYEYYAGTFLGSAVPEAAFPALELRAEGFLDYVTGGEAGRRQGEEAVRKAACAVAEAILLQEQGGAVAAERVGTWQRTYAVPAGRSAQGALLEAAQPYLAGLGILRTVSWA